MATSTNYWPLRRRLAYLALVLAFVLLAFLLSLVVPISFDRTFLIVFAVVLLWAGLRKPWWFWEHEDAFWLRDRVGDVIATLLYLVVAIIMLYFGIFTDAHLFQD